MNLSHTDVSILKTTLESAASLSLSKITAVMDKGFYKATNVDDMLSDQNILTLKTPAVLDFQSKSAKMLLMRNWLAKVGW